MTDQKECKKCEGLHAAFGFNGFVKVADQLGRITYGDEVNPLYYGDFYEEGKRENWPTCPNCGRSLKLYKKRNKSTKRKEAVVFFAVFLFLFFTLFYLLFL